MAPGSTHLPIVLRDEDLPADAVVIVRGGVLGLEATRLGAQDNYNVCGYFAISVEAALDATWEELCRTSPRIAGRYNKVRLSTAGRIRSAGFPLLPTEDRPHYDIVLADVADATIERLVAAFDEPVENPGNALRPGQGEYR